jgi:hypothetical protein
MQSHEKKKLFSILISKATPHMAQNMTMKEDNQIHKNRLNEDTQEKLRNNTFQHPEVLERKL